MGRKGYLFKLGRHDLLIRILIKGFVQIRSTDQAGNAKANQVDQIFIKLDIFMCDVPSSLTDYYIFRL